MSWKDEMYEAIAEYLRACGENVGHVTGLSEDSTVTGPYGCETCGQDYDVEYELDIFYIDDKGKPKVYYYDGGFTALLRSIT